MKVLITCGPTWVAIDSVRVLSNRSSGQLGHLMALEFHKVGAQVTLLEGPVSDAFKAKGIKVIKYQFFDELARILKAECAKKYDVIVHAAAVSDFKPAGIVQSKVRSGKRWSLHLVPTEKLIEKIKPLSPESRLVGFKLEPSLTRQNASRLTKELFSKAGCDLVVANTVQKNYQGYVLNPQGQILGQASSRKQMARLIRVTLAGTELSL